ncbi:cell wall hydrolase [Sphingopyxis indica]|uniref:Cell Wall Hydrolase n=1 Tax=Sphingopyxis indica TaxID=436663 RepID=A0A239EPN0_9SPHN|nr:cell wall hydrolase [Sphingopyxis indica]SNS45882.1 Cell Wall Hydrolase [Sphingopyxis indica]
MRPDPTPDTSPLWREGPGWLFALLAIAAIAAVLHASGPGRLRADAKVRPHPVAPPPEIVPAVEPMDLAPLTVEDAKAANDRIPLITRNFVPARPFVYPGDAANRARARDCMAAAMLYEAGDDSKGQLAVGQVVINRVRHPAFPKSICEVVFQGAERATGCQFTFTCDGALARRYSDVAWRRAQDNASMMLAGLVDPAVGLATHYHTDWVRPYWSDTLEKIAAIDTHLFFRWPGYWGTPGAFRGAVRGSDPVEAELAGISLVHSGGSLGELAGVDTNAAVGEADIIAGKDAPAGVASRDTILIQLDRSAPPESFVTLALRLCGTREYCKFMGWTNPLLKPDGEAMSATQRAGMTFSYLRDDKAGFEKALWNCSEYKRDDARQCMKR